MNQGRNKDSGLIVLLQFFFWAFSAVTLAAAGLSLLSIASAKDPVNAGFCFVGFSVLSAGLANLAAIITFR